MIPLGNNDRKDQGEPLVQTPFGELHGEISPDGRWLAYQSEGQIWVRPFPDVNRGRWQASQAGGAQPLWARSGRELFYLGSGGLMMVRFEEDGATWKPEPPVKLFDWPGTGGNTRSYDVAKDGRFLMLKPVEGEGSEQAAAPSSLVVIQHFDEELKRLVPTE
jgi:serine/threonine-protein kinase